MLDPLMGLLRLRIHRPDHLYQPAEWAETVLEAVRAQVPAGADRPRTITKTPRGGSVALLSRRAARAIPPTIDVRANQ